MLPQGRGFFSEQFLIGLSRKIWLAGNQSLSEKSMAANFFSQKNGLTKAFQFLLGKPLFDQEKLKRVKQHN